MLLGARARAGRRATWRRLLARALHLRARADAFGGALGRPVLAHPIARRPGGVPASGAQARPGITAGLLAIEGAHALDGDPANVDVVVDAGYRMMSLSHLFDNAFGGSAHGVVKGGLTAAGREMVERMEARGMIVDVAHASAATIDDVLAMATRPVVASHTGVRGTADNARNLSDAHAPGDRRDRRPDRDRVLAGGLPAGTTWPRSPGRSATRSNVAGVDHVALGSDFDGAVQGRSTRPAWSRSPTPCSRRASTTTRSPRSWAAMPSVLLTDALPEPTDARRGVRSAAR